MEKLNGPRLRLRAFRTSDWEAVHEYACDRETTQHLTWGPNSTDETRQYLQEQVAAGSEGSDVYVYALTLRDGGRLIGGCSLAVEHREILQGTIGFILNRAFWGRGLATESAYTLLCHGFEELGLDRVLATCRPENERSRRVLEKVGMNLVSLLRDDVMIDGEMRDSLLFSIWAQDWQLDHRRAVIFDMDGVIVNTEPVYYAANQRLFKKLGIEVARNDYAQFVGLDARLMWARLKASHRLPQTVEELVRMEIEGMLAGLAEADLAPMPGLRTLIETLMANEIKIGLASSSSHKVIAAVLNKLDLEEAFFTTTSAEEIAHGKPAPDIFLQAAKNLAVPPAGCWVIEDSTSGVQAAKSAGMRCIGFRNPGSGRQKLSAADVVVAKLQKAGKHIL